MRNRLLYGSGETFVHLMLEGEPGQPPERQAQGLFDRAEGELAAAGLSLEHTVRSRIFARTSDARTAGSNVRVERLAGQARAASSSLVLPSYFDSNADVGLELFAMNPPAGGGRREVREHEPKASYIRWLTWGPMAFLSGMTSERPGLDVQVNEILTHAAELLHEVECDWTNVCAVSFLLHKDHTAADLLACVRATAPVPLGCAEIEHVEGYSRPGKLIEIEITARR